ncbi:MAG TPA: methyltransferase domain-containing protein [Longimicrobium sp.]|nr:methyltransferase domain-containing protein [Longimicrobium sp.]
MATRIVEAPRAGAMQAALRRVSATPVVLDVGPGIQPQDYFPARTHVCVEAHAPYVRRLLAERAGDPRLVCLHGTWQEVLPHLPDASVDTAFALDLIEHLEKDEGYGLLREMARIARHQVVVFTPLGLYPQHYDEGQPDAWGMDGGYWQTHRSGWTPDDLARAGGDWEAVVSPDFHQWDQHGGRLAEPFGAFWAIRTLGPAPAGARDAWTASRGARLARAWRFHRGRLGRFARSPVSSGRRFVRRLAGRAP